MFAGFEAIHWTVTSSAPILTRKKLFGGSDCRFQAIKPLGSFSNEGPDSGPAKLVKLMGTPDGAVCTLKTPEAPGVFRNVSASKSDAGAWRRMSSSTEPAGAPDRKSSVPLRKLFGAAPIVA